MGNRIILSFIASACILFGAETVKKEDSQEISKKQEEIISVVNKKNSEIIEAIDLYCASLNKEIKEVYIEEVPVKLTDREVVINNLEAALAGIEKISIDDEIDKKYIKEDLKQLLSIIKKSKN